MSDSSDAAIRALVLAYDDAVRNEVRYQDWGMVDERVDAASRALFALDEKALPALDRIAGEGSSLSAHARFAAAHIRHRKPPPPPPGPDALAKRFHDKALWWLDRAVALDRLRAANDDEAIEILLALVGDDADRLADSMAAVGSHAEGALARGVRAVIARESGIVARFVGAIRGHAEEDAVRRMLSSRGRVRSEAVRAVTELGSVSSFARALESEWHGLAEDARRENVIALASVPIEVRCEALARWIDDPAPAVRVAALTRMKGAPVLGADLAKRLVEIVRSDPERGARAAAADLLGSMRPTAPEARAVLDGLRTIVLERPAARRDAMRAIGNLRRERAGEEPFTRFVPWDAAKFERAVAALAPTASPGSMRDVEEVVVVAHAHAAENADAKARALIRAITHPRGADLAPYLVDQLLGVPGTAEIADALGRSEAYRGIAVDPLRDRLVAALSGLPRSQIAHLANHENALIRDLAARVG